MSNKNQTPTELRIENQLLKTYRLSENWAGAFNNAVKWICLVFIARYGYLSIQALSGKVTIADIFLKLFSNVNFSITFSWVLTFAFGLYGWAQRQLRKSTVVQLHGRIEFLEKLADPDRTSSNLTQRGDTNPKDK